MAGTKDIKNFTRYPSLSDDDIILGAKTSLNGSDAGIAVKDFRKQVGQDVKPEIKNGYWWVNGVNTGQVAVGRSPLFRYTDRGLEMKYEDEDDAAYQVLIPIEDLLFTFDDLTPDQVNLLKLKFTDLTEAEKDALRGAAFTYDMFTPEQLAGLALTYDKLTPAQKAEIKGERGYSAFEVWQGQEGNADKTVDDYITWLREPATDAAADAREATAAALNVADHPTMIGTDHYVYKYDLVAQEYVKTDIYVKGEGLDYNTMTPEEIAGITGKSAYEVAVENGFVGTEQEWLASLKGEKGDGSEQVQPDWNATEGKGAILNKPTSMPANDVYAWAKAATKPAYTASEVGASSSNHNHDDIYQAIEEGKGLSTNDYTDDEKDKLAGVADNANNYVHPTTAGNKHIPAGGTSGQILRWSADGTAVWGVDNDTTYSPATETTNGLMSSDDKTKLDRIGSYTTATTVANLNANYENIEISNLSANASLSVNLVGTTYNGWDINVFIYCSSARTITIPTSGNYISMIGSSLSCPARKWTELNLHCAGGKWRIAKLEQQ